SCFLLSMFRRAERVKRNTGACREKPSLRFWFVRFQVVILACGYLAGLLICRFFPVYPDVVSPMSAVVFLSVLAAPTPAAIVASGFAGGVLISSFTEPELPHGSGKPLTGTFEGEVLSFRNETALKIQALVHVKSMCSTEISKVSFKAYIRTSELDLMRGDRIKFRARLVPYQSRGRNEVLFSGSVGSGAMVLVKRSLLPGIIGNIRRDVLRLSGGELGDGGAMLAAIAAGDRTYLSSDLSRAFRRTGVYHFLAISGVHVGSSIFIGFTLMRLLTLPWAGAGNTKSAYMLSVAGGSFMLLVYLMITGLSTSSIRAALFAAILLAAPFLGREGALPNNIALSLIVITAFSSLRQPDLSLGLSLAACSGIAISLRREGRLLEKTIRICLGAHLFTLPIVVVAFRGIPVFGPLFNLFSGFVFATVLIPLAVAGDFITSIFPVAGKVLFIFWRAVADPILGILKWAGASKWIFLPVNTSGCVLAVIASLVSAAVWTRIRVCFKKGFVLLLFPVVLGGIGNYVGEAVGNTHLSVIFPGFGQSDASYIRSDGGTVLIDTGPPGYKGSTPRIVRLLDRKGIRNIDALFLTHPHPDHVGGAVHLLRDFDVNRLILPYSRNALRLWSRILKECPEKTVVTFVEAGDRIAIGNMDFHILGPEWNIDVNEGDLNHLSMIVALNWRDFTGLFTGDAPWTDVAAAWKSTGDLELLKIPHHGSATGFENFGKERNSREIPALSVAVCTARRGYNLHLPSRDVVDWFERRGVPFLITGRGDGIVVEYYPGKGLIVK
ncbi:MAG: ComEC/Rec2 family competence protein, partial [bacterium]